MYVVFATMVIGCWYFWQTYFNPETKQDELFQDEPFKGTNVSIKKGSNVVMNVTNAQELRRGVVVSGEGIPNGTTILFISDTKITLSASATCSKSNASLFATEIKFRDEDEPDMKKFTKSAIITANIVFLFFIHPVLTSQAFMLFGYD